VANFLLSPLPSEIGDLLVSLTFCAPTKYYLGDQIEKNEMGGACSTYWGEKRCIKGYGGKT
jgi:hypothetical protein